MNYELPKEFYVHSGKFSLVVVCQIAVAHGKQWLINFFVAIFFIQFFKRKKRKEILLIS